MHKINTISPLDHKYLQILAHIDKPPKTLHIMGEIPTERRPSVAIIGARKPTAYGREVTHALAYKLATKGVVIISGLALGVDTIAHSAALEAKGTTIAVQANGLHKLYPSTNRRVGENIVANGGAIISEYPSGTEPMQFRFLERNRIVSGLADIVIVTEAASRSGTLNTAGHAIAQGKDLFAVPGNITSPMSAGCNQLLRQGAQPLLSTDDILDLLMPNTSQKSQASLAIGENQLEQHILDSLAAGMRDGDEILSTSSADPSEFNTALTMLEIRGIIRPLGYNQWTVS